MRHRTIKTAAWMMAAPMMMALRMAEKSKQACDPSNRWASSEDERSRAARRQRSSMGLWCNGDSTSTSTASDSADRLDLVDTALASGSLETLATALEAAGLIETLKGPGPFTVFAPVDSAFEALPEGALEGLLEDREKLTDVLLFHVVPGRLSTADLAGVETARTISGSGLKIDSGEALTVAGAGLVRGDIYCSNGVVHLIDKVLLPS